MMAGGALFRGSATAAPCSTSAVPAALGAELPKSRCSPSVRAACLFFVGAAFALFSFSVLFLRCLGWTSFDPAGRSPAMLIGFTSLLKRTQHQSIYQLQKLHENLLRAASMLGMMEMTVSLDKCATSKTRKQKCVRIGSGSAACQKTCLLPGNAYGMALHTGNLLQPLDIQHQSKDMLWMLCGCSCLELS
jgi:hypothetical protein